MSHTNRPVLYAQSLTAGTVNRIDVQTGEVRVLASGLDEGVDGIAVDRGAGAIVFTCMGRPDGVSWDAPSYYECNGSIQSIPLTGLPVDARPEVLVARGTFTTGKQLTRDPGTGRLYWCDREGRGVWTCGADGSDPTRLVSTAGRMGGAGPREGLGQQEWCVGVAVDPAAGHIYWTQKGTVKGGVGRILRASLTMPGGATAETRRDVEVLWDHLPEPIDLTIDAENRMLYWADRGARPDGDSLNRAPLPAPGERGAVPAVLSRDFQEAIGVALDDVGHIAYVSDLSGRIRRVDLGTGAESVLARLPGEATGLVLTVS